LLKKYAMWAEVIGLSGPITFRVEK